MIKITQRFLIVCTLFPVYILIGFLFGFIALLLAGHDNVILWNSLTPAVFDSFFLIPTGSAFTVITLMDLIVRKTTLSDRIALAMLVGGIYRLSAFFFEGY